MNNNDYNKKTMDHHLYSAWRRNNNIILKASYYKNVIWNINKVSKLVCVCVYTTILFNIQTLYDVK